MEINFEIPKNLNLDEIKEKQLNLVLSYPKTKKIIEEQNIPLDLVKAYIHYFIKVIKDEESFKKDDSLLNAELNGFISGIKYNEKTRIIEQTYSYIPKRAELKSIKEKYLLKEIDDSLFKYSLKDTLKHFANERKLLVATLAAIAKDGEPNKGIYIDGDPLTGKSFILGVFSKFLAKNKKTKEIAYLDSNVEFEYIKKLFERSPLQFEEYLEGLKTVQYLFIDDFGKEFKHIFNLDNILIPVLEYRKEHNLITFFSASIRPSEITSLYCFGADMTSSARKVSSLIKESTKEFSLKGIPYPF